MAERIVKKVGFPNLLCNSTVTWDVSLDMDRRRTQSQGRQKFRSGDTAAILRLGIPQMGPGDGFHLMILAAGIYPFKRADVALTATRELELREAR